MWVILSGTLSSILKKSGGWAVLFIALAIFIGWSFHQDRENCKEELKQLRIENTQLRIDLTTEKVHRADLEHILEK